MTFAEQMRDTITEQNWHKGGIANQDKTRFCLYGHMRVRMCGGNSHAIWHFQGGDPEEYIFLLHRVIAELYPWAVGGWLMSQFQLTPLGLIVWFNDHYAEWEQIRVVLEKAAAG